VELGLPLRRERKTTSLEEAKQDKDVDSKPSSLPTQADMFINLVNFPKNQTELEAFVKLRNPVNKIIVIKETKPENFEKLLENAHKPKVVEGEGDQPEGEGEEEVKIIEDDEREHCDNLIRAYDYKAFKGSRNSILKLTDLKVIHYEHIIEEPKEGAADPALKNSLEELKGKVFNEISESEQKHLSVCWVRKISFL
jgi:hypothetical protein